MSNDTDEPFISRWSRRKRDGGTGPAPAETSPAATVAPAAAKPVDPEPEVDPATLPRIEEMTAKSDFSVFLKKGVPEVLKRQALRHAWTIDPAIRDFVEVAENQYNWNLPGAVPGYGEIAAGTDVKALLAQAIGERPKVVEPSQTDQTAALQQECDNAGGQALEQQASSDQQTETVDAAVPAASGAAQIPREAPQPEDHETEDRAPPHRLARRRHGGALPTGEGAAGSDPDHSKQA